MGDPTGVGPEILLKAFADRTFKNRASFVVFGNFSYLSRVHLHLKKKRVPSALPFFPIPFSAISAVDWQKNKSYVPLVDSGDLEDRPLVFGQVKGWAGAASGCFISEAVMAAVAKKIDAIVTLPINKEAFVLGGWGRYGDHTQMLASLTRSRSVALMLTAGFLRAVHVTQHVPLKNVPRLITRERVEETLRLTIDGLRKMGVRRPSIAVCGLNPHAGDGDVLGKEESEIIRPVVKIFKKKGHLIDGPMSADTVWPLVKQKKYDAGIAMYHDQGQIPVKLSGEQVVNITLGLPFVRTSVGHGTAFDIAGQGKASVKSFIAAIETAVSLAKGHRS
jgi:4-phospho-D-threonate 3-dehydrogenase / 4-phospho-D-erythronate 3-dehydrogenase